MKDRQLMLAFQLAREEIASGRQIYICNALDRLHTLGKISRGARLRSRSVITSRLGAGHFTVRSWLCQHVPEFRQCFKNADLSYPGRVVRDYRLRWLDSLVKEFS